MGYAQGGPPGEVVAIMTNPDCWAVALDVRDLSPDPPVVSYGEGTDGGDW